MGLRLRSEQGRSHGGSKQHGTSAKWALLLPSDEEADTACAEQARDSRTRLPLWLLAVRSTAVGLSHLLTVRKQAKVE